MAVQTREKFATKVNSEILSAVRRLAQSEGRQLQALEEQIKQNLYNSKNTTS